MVDNSDFKDMKDENGFSTSTKYVMGHDMCYYESLKKGKNLDEKTDAAFYKGEYEVLDMFLKDLNKSKIDSNFVSRYKSMLSPCEEKIEYIVECSNGRLVAKDKIEIAYINGKRYIIEEILEDLNKFLKTQQNMKGHFHRAPVKKCKFVCPEKMF